MWYLIIGLLLASYLLIAESTIPAIDKNKISNIPLSSSYAKLQEYYLEPSGKNILAYTKENSTSFWWAILLLFVGLNLTLDFIGFARVHTSRDNEIWGDTMGIHEIKSQKLLTPKPTRISAAILTLIVTIVLFKIVNDYNHEKLIFDSRKRYFFHYKISKNGEKEILHSIPFKKIIGIQKITYDQVGEKFYNYEVNLVLSDYSRINLFATKYTDDIYLKSSFISNAIGREIIEHTYKD